MVDQHILDRTLPKNSMPLHECLLGRKFDRKHSLILSFLYSVCKSRDHQERTEEPTRQSHGVDASLVRHQKCPHAEDRLH